jgi:hypothetical protein
MQKRKLKLPSFLPAVSALDRDSQPFYFGCRLRNAEIYGERTKMLGKERAEYTGLFLWVHKAAKKKGCELFGELLEDD